MADEKSALRVEVNKLTTAIRKEAHYLGTVHRFLVTSKRLNEIATQLDQLVESEERAIML